MNDEILSKLGPLAGLAGVWEGQKGDDTAPAPDRGVEKNAYRERIVFEPFGPVDNHEQSLYGLRYSTVAHRIGAADSFHEETGYWMWDADRKQVFRAFLVPRGISVLAGGTVEPDARSFELRAELGSPVYGICSNPFLDAEFKTVRYELRVTLNDDGSFAYEEDTQLQIKGKPGVFHHVDKNVLRRVDD